MSIKAGSGRDGALIIALAVLAMARLPLLGATMKGLDPELFEEPLAELGLVQHAPFSPLIFAIGAVIFAGMMAALFVPLARARSPKRKTNAFPWWGWAGLALAIGAWIASRTWVHSFVPLWLGYILVVNGLAARNTGDYFLKHPRALAITLVSAVFWWFFEYLNRFVESWSYHGVPLEGVADVILFAVLPFATVLPAVMSTQDLLASWPRLDEAFAKKTPAPELSRPIGVALILIACAGLFFLSWLPDLLFPLLWLSPLLVIVGGLAATRKSHVFSDLARGDHRLVASSALAGLIAGIFWEMWNHRSIAGWSYAIPYVDVARVFEMPLLGYAGYLTFGWECAAVSALIGFDGRRRFRSMD